MTVIAAIKKNDEVWVASDRLTSWGSFTRSDLTNGLKLAFFQNAVIGSSGRSLYGNALRYCVNQFPKMAKAKFKDEDDVFRFFFQYYDHIKKNYNLGSADSNDVGKLSGSEFIVATADTIYEVSSCRDVSSFDDFTVIGSGHNIMIGAIHALNDVMDDPEEILTRAYETTCHYVSSCGGEMDLLNVTAELRKRRTKTARKTSAKRKTTRATSRSRSKKK